jgi:hypothetical protein
VASGTQVPDGAVGLVVAYFPERLENRVYPGVGVHGTLPLVVNIAVANTAPLRILKLAAGYGTASLGIEKGWEKRKFLVIHRRG